MNLNALEITAFGLLGAAQLLCLFRLLLGPRTPDRIVAGDTLSIITTAGLAGLAFLLDSVLYLDIALIYGVLAFVAVVALARAVEGGRSHETDG
jgi:multisubunit Na+/H+ antiporter MnhF subunit